ncbi:hypothetical protein AC781_11550 [Akkermansia glycaniphila]|nr:hypothetical protein AC781_11550 [Akkermansia glycaniphila]
MIRDSLKKTGFSHYINTIIIVLIIIWLAILSFLYCEDHQIKNQREERLNGISQDVQQWKSRVDHLEMTLESMKSIHSIDDCEVLFEDLKENGIARRKAEILYGKIWLEDWDLSSEESRHMRAVRMVNDLIYGGGNDGYKKMADDMGLPSSTSDEEWYQFFKKRFSDHKRSQFAQKQDSLVEIKERQDRLEAQMQELSSKLDILGRFTYGWFKNVTSQEKDSSVPIAKPVDEDSTALNHLQTEYDSIECTSSERRMLHDLLKKYVAAEQAGNSFELRPLYAPHVQYCYKKDGPATPEEILQSTYKNWDKWHLRKYAILKWDCCKSPSTHSIYSLVAEVEYSYTNIKTNKKAKGVAKWVFAIDPPEQYGKVRIVGFDEKIIRRDTGQ